jgi:hypothetical protein
MHKIILVTVLLGGVAPMLVSAHEPKEWWNSAQNGGITYPEKYQNGHHYVKRDGHWIMVHDD